MHVPACMCCTAVSLQEAEVQNESQQHAGSHSNTLGVLLLQPIFLQSFEQKNLQYLRPRTELPLVQLTSGATVSSFTATGTVIASAWWHSCRAIGTLVDPRCDVHSPVSPDLIKLRSCWHGLHCRRRSQMAALVCLRPPAAPRPAVCTECAAALRHAIHEHHAPAWHPATVLNGSAVLSSLHRVGDAELTINCFWNAAGAAD